MRRRPLLQGWEWVTTMDGKPAAALWTREYDVQVTCVRGSVEITGTPGAVAPWEIVAAVMLENGCDLASAIDPRPIVNATEYWVEDADGNKISEVVVVVGYPVKIPIVRDGIRPYKVQVRLVDKVMLCKTVDLDVCSGDVVSILDPPRLELYAP